MSRSTSRETFAALVARLAPQAAGRLFRKAVLASRLRHVASAQGREEAARVCSDLKARSLRRAAKVCPARLKVGPSEMPGLLSVRLAGQSLHLPLRQWASPQ